MNHHIQHSHMAQQTMDAGKLIEEVQSYRSFAFKKNMFEMAVAFIVASSFNKMVTALSENVLMPLAHFLTNTKLEANWRNLDFSPCKGLVFETGKFIGASVDFIIISITFYIIYFKLLSPLINKVYPKNEKVCHSCFMTINERATKCPHCCSILGGIS